MWKLAIFSTALAGAVGGCATSDSYRQRSEPLVPATGAARSERMIELLVSALSLVGTPYKNGGENPETGVDCSGFVRYVFRSALGLALPRSAADIGRVGENVDRADLQAGDLVFYNTLGKAHSHVGIYLGDGRFIHAPSSRGAVRVESMSVPYWARRFDGARRPG